MKKVNEEDVKVAEIEDLMQQHYTEISDMIDEYSESDKAFMLWYLLQIYISDTETQLPKIDIENATTYAVAEMMRNHIKVAREMREVLFYQWS